MDKRTKAKILADLVGTRYRLSKPSLKAAKDAAFGKPIKAIRCYEAILRSL